MYFRVKSIFLESNSAVENVRDFPHTLRGNGSSLIDLSCLFEPRWDQPALCLMSQRYTDFSFHWKTPSLLDHTRFSHRPSGTYGVSSSPSPAQLQRVQCHTCTVYKLEQLRFTATSYRPALPWEAQPRVVTLSMGHYYGAEDTSWFSPTFLIGRFNTSYRETAVLQISALCDIDKCAAWTLQKPSGSQACCSCLPSQHGYLNHPTHTHF